MFFFFFVVQIFDLQFSPFKENALVSCGVKQISFWTLIGNTLQKKKGIFGQLKDIQTMFCIAFSKEPGIIYTGTMNGQIYIWKDQELKEILSNVHSSSLFCLARHSNGYITGGKDSTIRIWDENFGIMNVIDLEALIMQNQGEFGPQIDNGKRKEEKKEEIRVNHKREINECLY